MWGVQLADALSQETMVKSGALQGSVIDVFMLTKLQLFIVRLFVTAFIPI